MRQASHILRVRANRQGLHEITGEVRDWVVGQKMQSGLLTVYCRHTSASLLIQENAAPEARKDLEAYFERLAPEDPKLYTHNDEGPDDMPSHLRAALTQVHLSIPVVEGRPALGTWQGIFLFEHRHRAGARELVLHLIGE
jgi:secondary thiamine-phosphate synthase enzyme